MLVTGATGAQGGSVARPLLGKGGFAVRCLTCSPDSGKAAALKQARAEIVRGDLDDPAILRAAPNGCHTVFGVTNFWEHFGKEYEQGRNLVDAVAGADDLANMFDFNRRFIPNRADDLAESRHLYPAMQTFEAWLSASKDRFTALRAA